MSEKSCITINCGCCGGGSGNKEDGAPVGTVISYMGTKAPEHYLVCDGAIINIADYAYLAEQIKDEFGAVDYFGGDGTSTFAVPDLRNEFLRGYRGDAEKKISGDIGIHQDGTEIPNFYVSNYGKTLYIGADVSDQKTTNISATGYDNGTIGNFGNFNVGLQSTASSAPPVRKISTRPRNVAVLYCIKCE